MTLYTLITLKRYIEQAIMFPFVLLGKLIAIFKPLKQEYDFFFFFPEYCIGGAEKVNAAIIDCIPDKNIVIFFTRHSRNDKLLHLFQKPNIKIYEISNWTDNKLIYVASFIYRGVCAHYINVQKKKPIVFNGQCNFAYKLFPHIKKNILKIELIHNSEYKFALITFPYIPFIDKRVMITNDIIRQHIKYYEKLGISSHYQNRIIKISNTVPVPKQYIEKVRSGKLKVYYAGRGGYQKRLELIFEIVSKCIQDNLNIEFHFAGTFENEIPDEIKDAIYWHGSISNEEEMYKFHQSMEVLLMTSRYEGFPMVIMEAMSCGVAVVSTAVNGIVEHIKDNENGFLLHETDKKEIVAKGIDYLKKLEENPALLRSISINNYEYAKSNFSKAVFENAYRTLFEL